MIHLPIEQIKKLLFDDEKIRNAIIADYRLDGCAIRNGEELSQALIKKLDQIAIDQPEKSSYSNRVVFEKAILAIASSSGSWVTIQKKIENGDFGEIFCGYDPEAVERKINKKTYCQEIENLLGGQSAKKNTESISKWAVILADSSDFYQETIVSTYLDFSDELNGFDESRYPMAVLCLAGIFGNPVRRWRHKEKFPGMRVPIACEFLRNLGWSGFKPDRHIIRALALWEPQLKKHHGAKVELSFDRILKIIETGDKEIVCPIKSAVYAIHSTPPDMDYSEADNILWVFMSNMVNRRQQAIFNLWLKNKIDGNGAVLHDYLEVTKLGLWPKSLICGE